MCVCGGGVNYACSHPLATCTLCVPLRAYVATGRRGLENVRTLRKVVVQFSVPVLAVVSMVGGHCIGIVIKVKPSAHARVSCACARTERIEHQGNVIKITVEWLRVSGRKVCVCVCTYSGFQISLFLSLALRAALCFSSSRCFSADASSTWSGKALEGQPMGKENVRPRLACPSSRSLWSGRFLESVGHLTAEEKRVWSLGVAKQQK